MDTTLALVVAAIVILITALVVITIFGNSMTPLGGMSSPVSVCTTQIKSSCTSGCSIPLTWSVPTVNVDGGLKPCKDVSGVPQTCTEALSGTPQSGMCANR